MVMTHDEALKLLSNVRFGILSGQIKDVTADVVDSLMEKIEPATLMVNTGKIFPHRKEILKGPKF